MAELECILTSCTAGGMAAALEAALASLSVPCTSKLLTTLVAQSALETGHFEVMRCWNLGNAKASSSWVSKGGSYTYYTDDDPSKAPVSENLTIAQVGLAQSQSKTRPDVNSSDMLVGNQQADGRYYCEFWAKHPQARFRAFKTLEDGAKAWVGLLVRRYLGALEKARSGDLEGYVDQLIRLGPYFTANRWQYFDGLKSAYRRYESEVSMAGEEALSDDDVFRSSPGDCAVDSRFGESFFELSSGLRMTCQPIFDPASGLTARLGHHPAAEWLAAHGMRLPTSAENHELFRASKAAGNHIDPYTMPTVEMLEKAGIPLVEKVIDRYRTQHMMSSAWCAIHDAVVLDALHDVGYESGPAANMGKHWISPAGLIEGWWYSSGSKIQNASSFHAEEKTFVDYATTFHGVVIEAGGSKPKPKPKPVEPVTRSTIRRGSSGADVVFWQCFLIGQGYDLGRWGDDGKFGPTTDRVTREYQRARGLTIDGVVGPQTWSSMATAESAAVEPHELDSMDLSAIKFIGAKHFTFANRQLVHWPVLHSTENPPLRRDGTYWPGKAQNVALWFAGQTKEPAPKASAHYIIGGGLDISTEIIQCVDESDIAWAAPGANRYGLQFEIVGNYNRVGSYPPTDWLLPAMRSTLERTAAITAKALVEWSIPLKHVSREELRKAKRIMDRKLADGERHPLEIPDECRGIITHADASDVWKRSDHCDPGGPSNKRWPMDLFLEMVESAMV